MPSPSGHYLLTGGAGYIGSHVLRLLVEQDLSCIVLDNLSKGHREAVPPSVPLFNADISNGEILSEIFQSYKIAGILHFAGFIEVGESMKNPAKYFENNVAKAIPLLEIARKHAVPWMVFSSSAAVYGEPEQDSIQENFEKKPGNIYGWTKLIFEQMLQGYAQSHGMRSISLRYFNAAGAHPDGEIGEDHQPESHLIPLACKALLGKIPSLSIFGNDYPTKDGTCVRDYVHIYDLGQAHLIAVKALEDGAGTDAYNIGTGNGYSVKEVLTAAEKISGKKLPVENAPRRHGDAAILVANPQKFQIRFKWQPAHHTIEAIVKSAWNWHSNHPNGFEKKPHLTAR